MNLLRTILIISYLLQGVCINAQNKTVDNRKLWLSHLDRIARPVFSNLANGSLKEKMPVVLSKRVDNRENRTKAAYLEAFGRTLSGKADIKLT